MSKKTVLTLAAVVLLFFTVNPAICTTSSVAGNIKKTKGTDVTELKILWAEWAPADYLQQICDMYENQTGIKVDVIQESWTTFPGHFIAEMEAHSTTWDMIIGDSQWLGLSATQGYYINLTDLLISEGIRETVTEATLIYYSEYPAGSGLYWAFPTEGDAVGWAYRKDLFENANEKAAFQTQYGYALDVPSTFQQLKDIATFFTRPDNNLYGVAIYTQKDYDAMTMGFESMLFSWGDRWQNPLTNEVMGIINSPTAVEAVQFYKDLYSTCQVPGLTNAFYAETNDAFITGKAAMSMNYFAFAGELVDTINNPYAQNTGFFANPAGPGGDQHTALGGQGISIVSFISPERQQAAKDFIKWFAREDIQTQWAELGGFTCNKNVLKSDAFLTATPYNPAFAHSMEFVMDFWNIPQYTLLLDVTQDELYSYIVEGNGTAQATMDSIAARHNQILVEYGYLAGVEEIPLDHFSLAQNYPNPFNSYTTIKYQLPESGFVTVRIFNVFGQEVSTLVNKYQEAGSYEIDWDAGNQPAGVYSYYLETDGSGQEQNKTVRKMLLIR
ncbi:MAG: extracellular solute-binding protein [Bacteroidota bacterium]